MIITIINCHRPKTTNYCRSIDRFLDTLSPHQLSFLAHSACFEFHRDVPKKKSGIPQRICRHFLVEAEQTLTSHVSPVVEADTHQVQSLQCWSPTQITQLCAERLWRRWPLDLLDLEPTGWADFGVTSGGVKMSISVTTQQNIHWRFLRLRKWTLYYYEDNERDFHGFASPQKWGNIISNRGTLMDAHDSQKWGNMAS